MTAARTVRPSLAAHRAAAVRVAALLAPPGARVGTGAPLGSWAALAAVPDPVETARRARVGLGAVTSIPVLETMLGLPHGLPVPAAALSARERQALAAAPAGCVDHDPDGIVRQARPPLSPALAVVAATRGWRAGLGQAGRYAPFCARVIVLDRAPRDLLAARVDAGFYGVGLVLAADDGELETLVAPEPYRPHRISVRRWWFAEQIHQALLAEERATAEAGAA